MEKNDLKDFILQFEKSNNNDESSFRQIIINDWLCDDVQMAGMGLESGGVLKFSYGKIEEFETIQMNCIYIH